MSHTMFVLQIPFERVLEVTASSVASAIDAATQALPYLGETEHERSRAMAYGNAIAYTLTCLLCHQVNPQRPDRTPLVAMQEHLFEHGLTQQELIHAIRVFEGTLLAGCYIWESSTHGAYFRASRYATEESTASSPRQHFFSASQLPERDRLSQRLTLRPIAGSPKALDVDLAGEDEQAWYGFLPATLAPSLLIWPKSMWKRELVSDKEREKNPLS